MHGCSRKGPRRFHHQSLHPTRPLRRLRAAPSGVFFLLLDRPVKLTNTNLQLGCYLAFDRILNWRFGLSASSSQLCVDDFIGSSTCKLCTDKGQQFLCSLGHTSLYRFPISAEDDQCIQKALERTKDRSKEKDRISTRNTWKPESYKLNRPHKIKDSKEPHRLPNRSTRQGSSLLPLPFHALG